MMHYTPTIVTGAERSVAELRRIFERAYAPVDMCESIETAETREPVVAIEPLNLALEPALVLKNETETELTVAFESAIKHDSEYEDALVHFNERKIAPIVENDTAAHDDERPNRQESLDPSSEAGSDSGTDVAVAPMPRQESNALKVRSLIRPPCITRSAPRLASTPSQVATLIASTPIAVPEVRETPRTMRHPKSNEQELLRARQWRENKKALDSRVAAAQPRYMEYTTSSRYIAYREASVAQRQQSTRTNGTTRATTTRRARA